MIWIPVIAALGGIVSILVTIFSYEGWDSDRWIGWNILLAIWRFIAGLVLGAIAGLVLGMLVGGFMPYKLKVYKTTQLVELRDRPTVQGSFFLGIGSISGETQYSYYYVVPGGFKHDTLPENGNNITIKQTAPAGTATLVQYQSVFADDSQWFWGIEDASFNAYDFIVPPGSIIQGVSLGN